GAREDTRRQLRECVLAAERLLIFPEHLLEGLRRRRFLPAAAAALRLAAGSGRRLARRGATRSAPGCLRPGLRLPARCGLAPGTATRTRTSTGSAGATWTRRSTRTAR